MTKTMDEKNLMIKEVLTARVHNVIVKVSKVLSKCLCACMYTMCVKNTWVKMICETLFFTKMIKEKMSG